MSAGSVLPLVAVQIAAFLVPIAAGLAGWVSGAVAGFASVIAWFAVGLPLSFVLADRRAARTLRSQASLPVPAAVEVFSPASRA